MVARLVNGPVISAIGVWAGPTSSSVPLTNGPAHCWLGRIAEWVRTSFGWVKAHNEVCGNEKADQLAKHATTLYPEDPQITEGGLKQAWKRMREEERRVKGAGMGRVVKWNRKARVAYVQCRTGKGNLQAWRHKIGKADDPECRKCGRYAETGKHVALVCTHGEEIGRRWGTWEDMDERARWARKEKDAEGYYIRWIWLRRSSLRSTCDDPESHDQMIPH